MKAWWYLASFLVPGVSAIGLLRGGAWAWGSVGVVFGVIPALDALFGVGDANRDAVSEERARSNPAYGWILYAHLPVQIALVFGFCHAWMQGASPAWVKAGWLLSTALSTGGVGITVAHELIHRSRAWERWIGQGLLLLVLYMHFAIEHVRGHHVRVATHEDPATAPRGMSLYRFMIRTVPAQMRSAWRLESERLQRAGKSVWSLRNQMLWFAVLQAGWLATLAGMFGPTFVLVYVVLATLSFSLLEIVNYLEHYGLRRRRSPNGRWEPVRDAHSWNSNHRLSRIMLFELSRHSNHHRMASRPYQILRSESSSPQLPNGYPGMVLLALVPPLWFRIMDPRLPHVEA